MKFSPRPLLIPMLLLSPLVLAQQESHVHGIASLNLVIDHDKLLIEFESPADNIVGFEHKAETAEEKAKIKAALATLKSPQKLITLPASAGCLLDENEVELHAGKGDDEHGHDEHDHDEHKEHDHDEHDHDEHKEHGHDEHDQDEHKEHEHDEHDHDDHASSHSEFHVSYAFTCAETEALSSLPLAVFEQYPSIEEIHLQAITPWGQIGADIEAKDGIIRLK